MLCDVTGTELGIGDTVAYAHNGISGRAARLWTGTVDRIDEEQSRVRVRPAPVLPGQDCPVQTRRAVWLWTDAIVKMEGNNGPNRITV